MHQHRALQLNNTSNTCTCWHLQTRTSLWQRQGSVHSSRQPWSVATHQGTAYFWHTTQKQATDTYQVCLKQHQQREQRAVTCQSSNSESSSTSSNGRKKVLMLGGTGRVGSSTAAALLAMQTDCDIFLGSREKASYDAAVKHRPELQQLQYVQVGLSVIPVPPRLRPIFAAAPRKLSCVTCNRQIVPPASMIFSLTGKLLRNELWECI